MTVLFYDISFAISVVLMLSYVFIWQKHFDAHLSLIFLTIPLANLGYCFMARATNIQEALLGNKICYFGGCFLPLFVTLAIFGICKINLNKHLRVIILLSGVVSYLSVLSIGYNRWFYTSVSKDVSDGYLVLEKSYGPMHTVYYVFVIAYMLIGLSALIYALFFKKDISNKIVSVLFIPELVTMISYFAVKIFNLKVELVPLTYDIAMVVFLIVAYRIAMYDVADAAIDSIVEKGNTGFASFDFKHRFLGSNSVAGEMLPFLNNIKVDSVVKEQTLIKWLEDFKADENKDKISFKQDDKIILININYLVSGKKKVGYQLLITDDTEEQKYKEMLEHFNSKLEQEVDQKTRNIIEMHDRLIISMATMVESRDNSTGGHIRRTSDCMRFLIGAMQEGGYPGLTEKFCHDIIKAAPMHDLGKIAVDDAILRFEGRYNDEQYAKMKIHAAEGARIVHEILKDTDDYEFHILAENVAHYHHERWDGSGYPEGLKGTAIPFEARIMAIADVYDALVSKRCYKDSMPFEKADAIIMDGFGTQFDASLKPYYVAARPKLEEYYRKEAN